MFEDLRRKMVRVISPRDNDIDDDYSSYNHYDDNEDYNDNVYNYNRVDFSGAEKPDVSLSVLIDYMKHDAKFQYVVWTLMAFSVGKGFVNSANTDTQTGRKCLEMLDDFVDEWNLDEMNQLIAIDTWGTGNSFLNLTPNAQKIQGIYHLPLSNFKKIRINEKLEKTYITITNTGNSFDEKEFSSDKVAHFRWLPINESAWGEGLGQVLTRKGRGYYTSSGKKVHRPSYFQMNEMFTDVNAKIFYSGQPRWITTSSNKDKPMSEKTTNQVTSAFKRSDPLQNITIPEAVDLKEVALSSRTQFDPLLSRFDKEFSAATKTPLIELISSMNFSYASSETALLTVFPLIETYKRAHKRFIEKNIYNNLILRDGKDPKVIQPRLNWGMEEKLKVEDIQTIQSILNQPDLLTNHDPQDIVNLLLEAGINVPLTDILIGKQKQTITQINDMEEVMNSSSEKITDLIEKSKD